MARYTLGEPVSYDPFGQPEQPQKKYELGEPVAHDPFAEKPGFVSRMVDEGIGAAVAGPDAPRVDAVEAYKAQREGQGVTLSGQIDEVGRGIPQGAMELAGGTLRGVGALQQGADVASRRAARGVVAALADPALPEERRRKMFFGLDRVPINPEVKKELRAAIQQSGPYAPSERVRAYIAGPTTTLEERALFRAGEAVSDAAKDVLPARPGYEDTIGRKLGEGLGSIVGGVAVSAVPYLGPLAAGTTFAAAGSGEAVDRAMADGATEDQILEAAQAGLFPGLTDSAPIELLLGRLRLPGIGRIKLPPGSLGKALKAVGRMSQQALVEGIQEGGQEFLQNLIAREIYKPEQELGENVPGSAGLGGGVGALAEGGRQLLGTLVPGRRRGARPAAERPAEPEQPTPQPEAPPVEPEPVAPQAAEQPAEQRAEPDDGLKPGTAVSFTYGGEPMEGTVRQVYDVADEETGETERGVRIETEGGVVDDFVSGLDIKPVTGTREKPTTVETREDLAQAEERVAEPSEAQKEAGNYAKGHAKVQGLDVTIETAKGQARTGTAPDGSRWSVEMPAAYGYVKRTEGADGEQVDVYVGDSPESDRVYVVDQMDAETGKFDEHKAMLGFSSREEAEAAYDAGFSDGRGRERMGAVTEMSVDEFRTWLKGDTRGPIAGEEPADAVDDQGDPDLLKRAEKARLFLRIGVGRGQRLRYDGFRKGQYVFRGTKRNRELYAFTPDMLNDLIEGAVSPLYGNRWFQADAPETPAGAGAPSSEEETGGREASVSGIADRPNVATEQEATEAVSTRRTPPAPPPERIVSLDRDDITEFEMRRSKKDEGVPTVRIRIAERDDGTGYANSVDTFTQTRGSGDPFRGTFPTKEAALADAKARARAFMQSVAAAPASEISEAERRLAEKALSFIDEITTGQEDEVPSAADDPADRPQDGDRSLADALKPRLRSGKPLTQRNLITMATEAYGGTVAQGAFDARRAYDALEVAANETLAEKGVAPVGDAAAARNALVQIEDVMARMPNQSRRTGETDAFQQFSTPPQYAFVANWLANIREGEQVLEPSAGNGGLAVFARAAGGDVVANEIGSQRRQNLEMQGYRVFGEDAEQLDNILPNDVKPTVVVMNPPFSNAGKRGVRKDQRVSTRHIQQALNRLEEGGRLVAIVGRGYGQSGPTQRDLDSIADQFAVRANIAVDGKVYRKYGTAFGTRILVIDKTAPEGEAVSLSVEDFTPETLAALEEVRNGRTDPGERPAREPDREDDTARAEAEPGPDRAVPDRTDRVGTGESGARRRVDEVQDGPRSDERAPARTRPEDGDAVPDRGRDAGDRPAGEPEGSGRGGDQSPAQPDDGDGGRVSAGGDGALKVSTAHKRRGKSLGDGVYDAYVPQKVDIEGAQPHPTDLVQSAAMASVDPPDPTYSPALPVEVATEGRLSEAQLEAVVYAGQAHAQTVDMTVEDEDGNPTTLSQRRGFFIGDGTGVGKGREISGILLDNFNQGRTKAVWVSEKKPLFNDAKRDFGGVGGDPALVFDMSAVKAGKPIEQGDGIAFLTYDTLKMKPKKGTQKSRLDQLVDWLGKDFDGVIAFDEAHNMGNAVKMKGARGWTSPAAKALAGVELQRRLPNARVVYVSATGATEVGNLSYADRLRLWGPGTAFASREAFISQITEGGLAAMELVARDLKSMGLYIARSLSFEGVEYGRLEHELSADQRAMYDTLAEAWGVVQQDLDKALELTGANLNAQAKSAAYSAFWGGHQRFFNQILTSMQMPTVLKSIEKDLKDGLAPVLQLVNTNEAAQERALSKLDEDTTLEDMDLTPRDQLMQLVENSFPVAAHEKFFDEEGNERSRPVVDSKGNPVIDKAAVAMRDALLDKVGTIRVPDGPLEMLLNKFGIDQVAEVTGRTRRVVEKNGKRTIERRSAKANIAEADAFMAGQKKMLIFSQAGGTGRSYHADINAKNQNRRRHYLLQPGWSAAPAIQGFGRTHRTNQSSKPLYSLVSTDAKGQKRFISSIARRLDQLGALTRGQRQTGSQGMFAASDNLESEYASLAKTHLIMDTLKGRAEDEGLKREHITETMGLKRVIDPNTGGIVVGNFPTVPIFLNRLLSLPLDLQDKMFAAFETRLEDIVQQARESGSLDAGVEVLQRESIKKKRDVVIHTDEETGAETRYIVVDAASKAKIRRWEDVKPGAKIDGREIVKYVLNTESRLIYAITGWRHRTADDGSITEQYKRWSQRAEKALPKFEVDYGGRYEEVSAAEAERLWNIEAAKIPEVIHEDIHVVSGTILPIWDRLPKDTPTVFRIPLDEGGSVLGRVIPGEQLHETLQALGADSEAPKFTGSALFDAVLDQGARAELANGYVLQRRAVGGEPRVRVIVPYSEMDAVRRQGLQFERVGYEGMLFLPDTDAGRAWLDQVLKRSPVRSVSSSKDERLAVAASDPAPEVVNRRAAVTELRSRLKQYGFDSDIAVRFVKRILIERDGKTISAKGRYASRLVDIAERVEDPEWVMDHEVIHGLRDLGVIRGREWETLGRTARAATNRMKQIEAKYARLGLTDEQLTEEAIADMFADWRSGRLETNPVRKAFERIMSFLRALGEAITGRGWRTAEDIFADIESGRMGDRSRKPGAGGERFAIDDPAPDGAFETFLNQSEAKPDPEAVLERVRADKATIAEAFRGTKPAEGVTVIRPRTAGDVPVWKRWVYTPEKIFTTYSGPFASLWKRAVNSMDSASRMTRELQRDVSDITRPLSSNQLLDLSTLLFKGDALEQEFTAAQLSKGYVGGDPDPSRVGRQEEGVVDNVPEKAWLLDEGRVPDPKVRKAYLEMRRFMTKLGRMVDLHERKMLPTLRARKLTLVRRLAKMRQMEVAEFRKLVNETLALRSRVRRGDVKDGESLQSLMDDLRNAEDAVFGQLIGEENQPFAEAYTELVLIESRLQKSSVQTRKGYFPHKFFGSFMVVRRLAISAEGLPEDVLEKQEAISADLLPVEVRETLGLESGESVSFTVDDAPYDPGAAAEGSEVGSEGDRPRQVILSKLITNPKDGFFATIDDAIRAANAYKKGAPDADLTVKPVEFSFPEAQATQLTDAAYHRFVGRVSDLLGISYEDAVGVTRESARKRYRRRIAGFKQFRKGVAGYSKEFERVIDAHLGQTVRYITMDDLKFHAINTIEKEGLSPNRSSIQERPVLASVVNNWLRDINGQKQPLEQQIDELFDKPWARPLNVAMGAGLTSFLLSGGVSSMMGTTGLTGAAVPLVVGSYVGYRFYKAMSQGGDFKTRAITGAMLNDMAHLKLGAFMNLFSPLVNTTQLIINAYPVLGEKYLPIGMSRYIAAMTAGRNVEANREKAKAKGETYTPNQAERDYLLLRRANVDTAFKYSEQNPNLFQRESMLAKFSLFWFSQAENLNRGSTFLGAYARASDKGASPGAAFREANDVMRRTQFDYSNANKPEALRNVLGRVPLQFKNYVAQQVAFMMGLDRKELPRFMMSVFLMAGVLGLPFLDLLDILSGWIFGEDKSALTQVKIATLEAQSKGELAGSVADFAAHGAPALFGMDLTSRVGMGEKFLPTELRDLKGPWWTTLENAVTFGGENATIVDQLRNLSAGLGAPLKSIEAMANGMPLIETLATNPEAVRDALGDDAIVFRSPWQRGRIEYHPTPGEVALKAVGGSPLYETKLRTVRDVAYRKDIAYTERRRRLIDQIVRGVQEGKPELVEEASERARELGIRIKPASVRYAVRQAGLPRAQRVLQNLPTDLRPEVAEYFRAIDRGRADPATAPPQ